MVVGFVAQLAEQLPLKEKVPRSLLGEFTNRPDDREREIFRGKSGLYRAGCWLTARLICCETNWTESATENKPRNSRIGNFS